MSTNAAPRDDRRHRPLNPAAEDSRHAAQGASERSRSADLDQVTLAYGPDPVLEDLDLHVPNGALMVLVGPSGCGKTSCLRLLAGLEEPRSGRILLGGHDVTRVPARDRHIAMVFQNYALYPHMDVRRNVAFGLDLQARHDRAGTARRDADRQRVTEVLELLELQGLEDRRPGQLSGGQQQRVALARAIVREPHLFLMDEPLSNLDAQLRVRMRQEIVRLHQQLRTTLVYVTHDQVEALSMATRLAVMDQGRVEQVGTPQEVHDTPDTTFVAAFIGSPAMSLVAADQGRTVGWRPSRARLADPDDDRHTAAVGLRRAGHVEAVELLGEEELVTIAGPWGRATALRHRTGQGPVTGDRLAIEVAPEDLHTFNRHGRRTP